MGFGKGAVVLASANNPSANQSVNTITKWF